MLRSVPGFGLGCRELIDLGFEPCGEHLVGLVCGTRPTDRRHPTCAKLAEDPLRNRRVFTDPRKIEAFEGEITPAGSVVMAGDAVLAESCLKKFGFGGRLRLGPGREGRGEQRHSHWCRCCEDGRQRKVS